uniref:Uncharacterized protein n=1 Tax=Setaria italica TaxID=4555 RepID=K3YAB8_SETIT
MASAISAHSLGESRSSSSSWWHRAAAAWCSTSSAGSQRTRSAASAAAARTSPGCVLAGRGSQPTHPGKLSCASRPRRRSAATSCATAAISADSKLPSQMRVLVPGCRISDTHLPHFRFLTPRYCCCCCCDDDDELLLLVIGEGTCRCLPIWSIAIYIYTNQFSQIISEECMCACDRRS